MSPYFPCILIYTHIHSSWFNVVNAKFCSLCLSNRSFHKSDGPRSLKSHCFSYVIFALSYLSLNFHAYQLHILSGPLVPHSLARWLHAPSCQLIFHIEFYTCLRYFIVRCEITTLSSTVSRVVGQNLLCQILVNEYIVTHLVVLKLWLIWIHIMYISLKK